MIQTTSILDLDHAKRWLSQQLSHERFEHSVGAQEKAVELAEKFNLPMAERERAAIAGLLHDAAKLMRPPDLLAFCESHQIPIDDTDRASLQTLHPFVGAELVRETFQLEDPEILNAIRFHTTGRAGMSRVEKIVYIADKIEGNTRNPLYILDSTIQYLIERHQVIHPRTIEARNDFITQLRAEKHL